MKERLTSAEQELGLEQRRLDLIGAIRRLPLLPATKFSPPAWNDLVDADARAAEWLKLKIDQAANDIMRPILRSATAAGASRVWAQPATSAKTRVELSAVWRAVDLLQKSLHGLHKPAYYALLAQNVDPLEQDGLPTLLNRLASAAASAADEMTSVETRRGAPEKVLARAVRDAAAKHFEHLTGRGAKRTTPTDGSRATGPFVEFLRETYRILAIDASAEAQAR